LPNILLDLRDTLRDAGNTLTYFRYKRGRRIAKRITHDSRASLLKRISPPQERTETAWLCSHEGRSSLKFTAANLQSAIDCGKAIALLARLPRYAELPLPIMLKRLRPALEIKQYRLLCSPAGEPRGFYSWAWREATEIAMENPLHALEAFEWRDGRDALLCDVVATSAGIDDLKRELCAFMEGDLFIYPNMGSEVAPDRELRYFFRRDLPTMPIPEGEVCDLAAWCVSEERICEI